MSQAVASLRDPFFDGPRSRVLPHYDSLPTTDEEWADLGPGAKDGMQARQLRCVDPLQKKLNRGEHRFWGGPSRLQEGQMRATKDIRWCQVCGAARDVFSPNNVALVRRRA